MVDGQVQGGLPRGLGHTVGRWHRWGDRAEVAGRTLVDLHDASEQVRVMKTGRAGRVDEVE
jgi:hypothetical protein